MHPKKTTTSNSIAVILTVALFVLAWIVVLPNYFSHKVRLIDIENEVNAARAKLDSIDKTKVELAEIKNTLDQVLVSVPEGQDVPDLITELEAIGAKNGINIPTIDISASSESATQATNNSETMTQSVATPATVRQGTESATDGSNGGALNETPGEPTASTSGNVFNVSFTVSGSFEALNGLIADLEKSVRFMNIQSFTYETSDEAGGSSLALQIEVYQR